VAAEHNLGRIVRHTPEQLSRGSGGGYRGGTQTHSDKTQHVHSHTYGLQPALVHSPTAQFGYW
jgi:hypothetical protein